MFPGIPRILGALQVSFVVLTTSLAGQQPPYDVFPAADPPYYRVRYEASTEPGELIYPVNYTIWIPPGVKSLRGVIVHQHGCGEGSCKSGLTGAYDLHWQALATVRDIEYGRDAQLSNVQAVGKVLGLRLELAEELF